MKKAGKVCPKIVLVGVALLWILAGCRGSFLSSSSAAQVSKPLQESRPTLRIETIPPTITTRPSDTPVATPTLEKLETKNLPPTATAPATPAPFQLCSPLAEISLGELPEIISDPYSAPPPRREERHEGVDFSFYRRGERLSIQGLPIQSVLAGVVAVSIQDQFPYGNMVVIETPIEDLPAGLAGRLDDTDGESLYILYAHMDASPLVALGQAVEPCQVLGAVGKTGNAGVAHLHLETRIGLPGQQFTSMAYYDLQATEEEKANYLRWRISWEFRHFDPMDLLSYK